MMPTPAPDDFVTTALASLAATLPTARLWAAVAPQEPAGQGTGADCIATQFALLQAAEGFIAPDTASATRLRRLGWRGPLALLPGVADARGLEACSRLGLWHGIGQAAQIDWLAAHKSQQPQPVLLLAGAHGMAAHHLRSRYARLAALPQVEDVTLWAQASDGAAATALMAALQPVAQDWIGLRSIAVPVHLQTALPWPSLHSLAQQAEQHGWDVELMCCI